MVPNGWSEVKLGDVIAHQKGFAFKSENYCHDGKRIIRISDTDRNSIHDRSPVYVSDENSVGLERYSLSEGDIILSTVGSRPHLLDSMVGKAVQIPAKDDGALLNQNLVKLSPKKKVITNNYLFSMLKKNKFNFFISTLVRGNANQVSITLNELFSYSFLLPTYEEQRKIAQILSTWDRGIATTEKLIDASKQQKKALMQQLLTGKKRLVDPETGKAFEGDWRKSKTPYESLPSDWSELALEKLSSFITKGATPTTYGFEWQEYGIPFLRSECVGKNGFKESGLNYICDDAHEAMARSKVYAGDILITITGNVGRVCRLPNKYPQANINQHIAKVTLKDENVCSDFIFHCLQDNKYQSNFERITTGQAYPQISLVQVRNTIVPLPPISEQQKIASVLTAADKEIELLEAKLAHFKQEKKALMQQLLTGKRRVSLSS
ncbi:type I restriction-modification system specificity subunit S [Photobacterium leiognathi lrivu.4.1]|uniref:Type I restriction-modification system specificity subunit S n=1 Tax=Photobacterium leiognathi lrivu.4.1 TaxID=1248232 RepID=V5H0T7_PHOLE|nr:restriction endonuclease subunit S [Photobacterium leiognathi]GAD28390.1 type I restriction-modification system specificity subunit S [Photobacterium leiognathi lrivu.4.1]